MASIPDDNIVRLCQRERPKFQYANPQEAKYRLFRGYVIELVNKGAKETGGYVASVAASAKLRRCTCNTY